MDWGKKKLWGEGVGPKDWIYGRIPLERILRRGMLAQALVDEASPASSLLQSQPPSPSLDAADAAPDDEEIEDMEMEGTEGKKVSRLIAHAKQEMIKNIPDWAWEEGKKGSKVLRK